MSSLSPAVTASQTFPASARENALAYLRHHDDPMRWEAPRMFNRCAELRRFERFVASFEALLGRKLDYAFGAGLDDAAFHGDVFFEAATIRFSNFGRMVAILDSEALSLQARRVITQLAEDHGYIVIPDAVLSLPHSGLGGQSEDGETWGSRFFGAM